MGVKTSDSRESLAPELRALVLRRVLQMGSRETGKGRCVVAVAGVCRSWHQAMQLLLEE
jgi:hypothetical protein